MLTAMKPSNRILEALLLVAIVALIAILVISLTSR